MEQKDERIFTPARLDQIVFRNRILKSATFEGMADETGKVSSAMLNFYERLAQGGVGGIITGGIGIVQSGKAPLGTMAMLDTDENVESFQQLVQTVHAYGVPILAQLDHYGRYSKDVNPIKVTEYSTKEIQVLIHLFVNAAIRAYNSGFDGIELNAGMGSLLSEFLSTYTNARDDQWGGTEEKRCRILIEIISLIHDYLPNYPIVVKINGEEYRHTGMDTRSSGRIAEILEACQVSAIEVTNGLREDLNSSIRGTVPFARMMKEGVHTRKMKGLLYTAALTHLKTAAPKWDETRLYNLNAALNIRKRTPVPLIVTGGIHDLEEIRTCINRYRIDFVSMGRPLLQDPSLVQEYENQTKTVSGCTECNACLNENMELPIHCPFREETRE